MIEKKLNANNTANPRQEIPKPVMNIKTAVADPNTSALTVQEYFDKGNAKIEQQDYKGAIAWFSQAIKIEANSKSDNNREFPMILIRNSNEEKWI